MLSASRISLRAKVRAICDVSCGIQPVQNLRVLRKSQDGTMTRTKPRRKWNGAILDRFGIQGFGKALNPLRVDIVLVIALRWLIFVLFLKSTMRIGSRSICHNFLLFHALTNAFVERRVQRAHPMLAGAVVELSI